MHVIHFMRVCMYMCAGRNCATLDIITKCGRSFRFLSPFDFTVWKGNQRERKREREGGKWVERVGGSKGGACRQGQRKGGTCR